MRFSFLRRGFRVIVVILLAVSPVYAGAPVAVLDQDNSADAAGGRAVANDRTQAQTVTAGVTGILSHVNVLIFKGPDTFEDITLSVLSTSGGDPDAFLTSTSLPSSAVSTVTGLVTFDVSAANLSFNAGDLFAIELTSLAENVSPFQERYGWVWHTDNPYAGGQQFTSGVGNSGADLTFQTFVIPAPLQGDLDGNGFVGIDDLNIVLSNWNQNVPPGDPLADPSGDGFVGIDDLNEVLGNWNAGTPPESTTTVPEPGTAGLLGLASLFLACRRGSLANS